jgi:hypothetical protein
MYPLIWSKVVGVWLKSRRTKNIRKTDHLRDISAVVVSFLMAKQRDYKGNISPEGSQHSPSCVAIPRVVQETEALEHRLAFSFGNTILLREPATTMSP